MTEAQQQKNIFYLEEIYTIEREGELHSMLTYKGMNLVAL